MTAQTIYYLCRPTWARVQS